MSGKSIHLNASMQYWDEFIAFIDEVCATTDLSSTKSYRFKLAAEELLSNIVRSSESNSEVTGLLSALEISSRVVIKKDSHNLEVLFSDNAPQFDPHFDQRDTPNHIEDPVSTRPIGGLGLYLVQDSVDAISYEFVDGRNTYMLMMQLEPTPQ